LRQRTGERHGERKRNERDSAAALGGNDSHVVSFINDFT
jgi:hypothetical protein